MAPKQNVNGFTIVRKGTRSVATPVGPNIPIGDDDPAGEAPVGTVVAGPDGIQWIAMAAVPARWERAKRTINTGASEPQSK